MATSRMHPHHSLPAPVVHATFSTPQSKSHVLAGVQDAYWSDDEAEDAECPLCLEEMDISDLNFKPCICGYQICRFCWHHIKENLNKRCPACRRIYTDDAVEFKPIATQDHKRLTQQKKQRDRERKDLETLGRRHLANVRVVQRNVVYVVGIGPRFAKEELIPTLRSNEYFGQYGKITKILLVKRNSPGGGGPVVGLYITYHRREDAARAISAVDGTPSPGGGREVMRASYGTTKYCMAFLRGVACSDHSCMNLHEWGDEKDCFTKEDLTTLKHTMKATESRNRTVTTKKGEEDAGLPRAASWAQKGSNMTSSSVGSSVNTATSISNTVAATARQTRRTGATRQARSIVNVSAPSAEPKPAHSKSLPAKVTQAPASRPPTPATAEPIRAQSSNEVKVPKQQKEAALAPQAPDSPSPSLANASDMGSVLQEQSPSTPNRPQSTESSRSTNLRISSSKLTSSLLAPPGLPAPPGLSAPPGISSPSRPPRAETASPQTPLLASQTSYQMSTAARALLDDVKARRESVLPVTLAFSPFPEFDRTLQTLSGEDGGFSFNFDPKLADAVESADHTDFTVAPFHGSFIDAFPALRTGSPFIRSPSLGFSNNLNHPIYDPSAARVASEKQAIRGSGYLGSFNPFSEPSMDASSPMSSSPLQRSQYSPVEEERKVSRFGFARGRQSSTATSSPMHSMSPLSYNNDLQPFDQLSEEQNDNHTWPPGLHDPNSTASHSGSILQPQPQSVFQHQERLQPINGDLSEAQLRSFIQSSQEKENGIGSARNPIDSQIQFGSNHQAFEDPAIMSASFVPPANDRLFTSVSYGPPPGLPVPPRLSPSPARLHQMEGRSTSTQASTAISPAPALLSSEDFPALAPSPSEPLPTPYLHVPAEQDIPLQSSAPPILSHKEQEKAQRKAAKKSAAAEKALERQKIANEKAEAKAVEKVKLAKEKAAEKEKAALLLKSQQIYNRRVDDVPSSITEDLAITPTTPVEKHIAVRQQPSLDKFPSVKRASHKGSETSLTVKRQESAKPSTRNNATKSFDTPFPDVPSQVPILSKKPKKNKPVIKPVKAPKEEDTNEDQTLPSTTDASRGPGFAVDSTSNSRSESVDRQQDPTSVQELLSQIDAINPGMDLSHNSFFDVQRLISPAKMPLEYGPLVHALSALSVGGGSFANNMPSGSIDNAVSSFQQLLETLTQTISDLLRLLPRTTWDDSSSFDGVLRDMLKGDDFLDDGEDGPGREDEVAALTLALERRARWMEVQLSKLEELHRDINTAAVRAVLSFNDSGWDRHSFLPRIGNTLRRFDKIGMIEEQGQARSMTADELDKKLIVAKEAAIFAEAEIREAMVKFQSTKVYNHDSL
ncbi:hypothetical protein CVT25_011328 [Psilocybe cyanescens]|uniref:RING-type domain-containing protein n=1 Tax=Psilocybe cyanescens TaxID=93625 RepID=A0A409WGC7_PSICY|nr:hypothetical protein CVT25_011328 [Psilocybe cyanescens]